MVAAGRHFSAYVNGTLVAEQPRRSAERWHRLTLADTDDIPSLPTPRGIDRVRSRSLGTATCCSRTTFRAARHGGWTGPGGRPMMNSGGVGARIQRADHPAHDGHDWHNYAVDVTFRNIATAGVRCARRPTGPASTSISAPSVTSTIASLARQGHTVTRCLQGREMPRSQRCSRCSRCWCAVSVRARAAALAGSPSSECSCSAAGVAVDAGGAGAIILPSATPWIAMGAIAALAFGVTRLLQLLLRSAHAACTGLGLIRLPGEDPRFGTFLRPGAAFPLPSTSSTRR